MTSPITSPTTYVQIEPNGMGIKPVEAQSKVTIKLFLNKIGTEDIFFESVINQPNGNGLKVTITTVLPKDHEGVPKDHGGVPKDGEYENCRETSVGRQAGNSSHVYENLKYVFEKPCVPILNQCVPILNELKYLPIIPEEDFEGSIYSNGSKESNGSNESMYEEIANAGFEKELPFINWGNHPNKITGEKPTGENPIDSVYFQRGQIKPTKESLLKRVSSGFRSLTGQSYRPAHSFAGNFGCPETRKLGGPLAVNFIKGRQGVVERRFSKDSGCGASTTLSEFLGYEESRETRPTYLEVLPYEE